MSTSMPTALAGGRYQLGQLIGRGGMAEVHVALDTRLGRTVAVKIMRADLANDDIFLARFRREAHAVAQMSPGILPFVKLPLISHFAGFVNLAVK